MQHHMKIKNLQLTIRFTVVIVLVFLCVSVALAETISTIATNSSYHCRRTFGTGLYDSTAGKTWVCWSGPAMDIYLREYNHSTNAWNTAVKVKDWDDTGTYAYHDYPVMLLLPDGKLGMFLCDHTVSAYLLKAPNAHSSSGTWSKTQFSTDKNCYPMPIISGGVVYFFYSRNDDTSWPYRTYWYIKSSDSGATWSAPVKVIDTGKQTDKFNEVYAFGVYEKTGKIYLAWTMGGGPKGHNGQCRNLYLAYLNTADGIMYNAAGSSRGSCVDNGDLSSCLVLSSSPKDTGDYWDLHPIQNAQPSVCDDGTVVVGFGETKSDGNKYLKFAKYVSGSWSISTVENATSRFMDMVKCGSDDFEMLFTTQDYVTLRDKKTTDKGGTWSLLYSMNVPYSGGAETTFYVNFIESRNSIRAVGHAIDYATRQTDHSGIWPIFAVKQ